MIERSILEGEKELCKCKGVHRRAAIPRGTHVMVLVIHVPSKQSSCIATEALCRQDLYLNSLQHLWLPLPSSKEEEGAVLGAQRGWGSPYQRVWVQGARVGLQWQTCSCSGRRARAAANLCCIGAGSSFKEERAVLLGKGCSTGQVVFKAEKF